MRFAHSPHVRRSTPTLGLMMDSLASDSRSFTERLVSCGFVLVAAAACLVGWRLTGVGAYLVCCAGFLFLAPLWYRSPVSFQALRGPVGGRLTPRRRFSRADMLFTFFGYGFVLTGVGLGVFA